MAAMQSIAMFPWSIKIIYGLFSDNVPIFGTRRKSYLVLMGILQFFAYLSLYLFEPKDALATAIILAVGSLSMAFINVLVDAIMCVEARKDPAHGT